MYAVGIDVSKGKSTISIIIKGMNEPDLSNTEKNYDFDTFFEWLTNLISSNQNVLEVFENIKLLSIHSPLFGISSIFISLFFCSFNWF